jgi:hypothetical protein
MKLYNSIGPNPRIVDFGSTVKQPLDAAYANVAQWSGRVAARPSVKA